MRLSRMLPETIIRAFANHHPVPMDTPVWMLLTLALVMAGVAWHARRPGDERRGIAVLGTVAALVAIGSAAAVVF